MIRKDQLPNIWGDGWQCTAPRQQVTVSAGSERKLVLCADKDASLFMLRENGGYTVIPDLENLAITVEEGALLSLYRLQGPNTPALNFTQLEVTMARDAQVRIGTVTLGGGHVRNNIVVRMQGEGCSLQADGLYLMDHEQLCDNYLFVEHACPHCTSHALYKGIIDDQARAQFNGHVLVQDGASKTEASQTNRNILLTDKAHVESKPFLEIYNDDVKCSHGSTTGQMDTQALFYMQTRGITERTARTMLSYAFCDEVVQHIDIASLRDAVSDMVKKRLHGELTSCADCELQCSTPCNGPDVHFEIKL